MQILKEEWDKSYENKDNFVFYPHEEVIRFVSKYIRKRVGLDSFTDIYSKGDKTKILDLGCGIGRHVIYSYEMGLDSFGIDLSDEAIKVAKQWAEQKQISEIENRFMQGDIRNLPWSDKFFDFAVSHGVLDSMNFEIAKAAVHELSRVLKKGGLFYCDLISGDDSEHSPDYADEEIVCTEHEKGTVQSYFNLAKINNLFGREFEVLENILIRRESIIAETFISRYHLVLRRI